MNKITASLTVAASAAIIAFSGGVAAAAPGGPTAAWCQSRHYTNYGQCRKNWNHWVKDHNKPPKDPGDHDDHGEHGDHHPHDPGGHGYGSGSASSDISLTLNNSNNNIIHVVINQIINIFR